MNTSQTHELIELWIATVFPQPISPFLFPFLDKYDMMLERKIAESVAIKLYYKEGSEEEVARDFKGKVDALNYFFLEIDSPTNKLRYFPVLRVFLDLERLKKEFAKQGIEYDFNSVNSVLLELREFAMNKMHSSTFFLIREYDRVVNSSKLKKIYLPEIKKIEPWLPDSLYPDIPHVLEIKGKNLEQRLKALRDSLNRKYPNSELFHAAFRDFFTDILILQEDQITPHNEHIYGLKVFPESEYKLLDNFGELKILRGDINALSDYLLVTTRHSKFFFDLIKEKPPALVKFIDDVLLMPLYFFPVKEIIDALSSIIVLELTSRYLRQIGYFINSDRGYRGWVNKLKKEWYLLDEGVRITELIEIIDAMIKFPDFIDTLKKTADLFQKQSYNIDLIQQVLKDVNYCTSSKDKVLKEASNMYDKVLLRKEKEILSQRFPKLFQRLIPWKKIITVGSIGALGIAAGLYVGFVLGIGWLGSAIISISVGTTISIIIRYLIR
jgi:transcriptional regulator CtsR